jgi:hypothetical protein
VLDDLLTGATSPYGCQATFTGPSISKAAAR